MTWQNLTIIPKITAPYHYDAQSLSHKPGLMMQLVKDWTERGIEITVVLHQNYTSPLLPWNNNQST